MNKSPSLTREIIGALIGGFVVRILGMGVTFLVGVQLARYLGTEGVGIYGTVMAIIAFVVVPAQLGMPQLITREIAALTASREYGRIKTTLMRFSLLVCAVSCIAAALGFLALFAWPLSVSPTVSRALCWGLVGVPLIALLNLAIGALRGFQRVVSAQTVDALIRPALFAPFLAVAAVLGSIDAGSAIALQTLAAAIALSICFLLLARTIPQEVRGARQSGHQIEWTRAAASMTGTEVLRVLDGQYAMLLLGIIASLHDVGILRVSISVAGLVGLPAALINVVVMFYVARLHAEGDRRRLQIVAAGSALVIFSSIAVSTLFLYLFGERAIAVVFGNAFTPAWAPLVLMGLAYMVNGFFGSVATILNMCGQERTVTAVYLVGPIVGVCVTLALLGTLGISAVAVAMIISEAIKGVWMARVARDALGLNVSLTSARALIAHFNIVRAKA